MAITDLKFFAKRLAAVTARNDERAFKRLERIYIASPEAEEEGRRLLVSYRALLELEALASAANLEEQYRPRMWWMRGPYPGNFGDVLTPYVLWHAFGVAPRWTNPKQSEGIAIGSIAKFARPGMKVWGSGMPRANDKVSPEAIWAAVRGPSTRVALLQAGAHVPEIYGDPAVLLPELYNPKVDKTHAVGIIAHVLQEEAIRERLESCPDAHRVKLISLSAGTFEQIERVIRDIKSCHEIISTSLHGVIVAHAYGIPCQSAKFTRENVLEDSFKMRDYKLSVQLEDSPIRIPNDFQEIDWIEGRRCVLPPQSIDTVSLREAFPFPARFGLGSK